MKISRYIPHKPNHPNGQVQRTIQALAVTRSLNQSRTAEPKRPIYMAIVPSPPMFAEVNMGADSSAPTVRATVVQASTVFYDTPATLGVCMCVCVFLTECYYIF